MKQLRKLTSTHTGIGLILLALFSICLGRVYMRVETTLIGYQLGKYKKEELALLEKRSDLQMTLSKLTSKSHLQFIASVKDFDKAAKRLAMNDKD